MGGPAMSTQISLASIKSYQTPIIHKLFTTKWLLPSSSEVLGSSDSQVSTNTHPHCRFCTFLESLVFLKKDYHALLNYLYRSIKCSIRFHSGSQRIQTSFAPSKHIFCFKYRCMSQNIVLVMGYVQLLLVPVYHFLEIQSSIPFTCRPIKKYLSTLLDSQTIFLEFIYYMQTKLL